MPETSSEYIALEDALTQLQVWQGRYVASRQQATAHKAHLNIVLRNAQKAGATISELARITGLSRAQVQRICDYSKDRGQ